MNQSIRIVVLTEAGQRLAEHLLRFMPNAVLCVKPKPFSKTVQKAFLAGEALIMICATGIAVRTLAPVLNTKHTDPPVLVLDELGQYVIPLLSGHEGGANNWASFVATYLQAQLVLTTAKSYLNPIYTVGMGCERGCPELELKSLLMTCLQKASLSCEQIYSINSIDVKSDEQGLIALAATLGKPYGTFDVTSLSQMEYLLSVKSDYVFKTVGVYGVAESSALWAAHLQTKQVPELIVNKVKTKKATCSIARSYPMEL